MTTFAPSSARRLAIAAPIPREPPVTSAIFPSRFLDIVVPPIFSNPALCRSSRESLTSYSIYRAFHHTTAGNPSATRNQLNDWRLALEVRPKCWRLLKIQHLHILPRKTSFAAAPVGPKITPSLQLFRSQCRLPQVICQMI